MPFKKLQTGNSNYESNVKYDPNNAGTFVSPHLKCSNIPFQSYTCYNCFVEHKYFHIGIFILVQYNAVEPYSKSTKDMSMSWQMRVYLFFVQ